MKHLLALLLVAITGAANAQKPAWQPWGPEVFEQAAKQEKYIFLYLEAVWCHWCHVMQAETLRDSDVLRQLGTHYLSVRVDHDNHPALANRYRAWGWPALIFLAPDGTEIVKRAGHIAPVPFARLLKTIVRDPDPESDVDIATPAATSAYLTDRLRNKLRQRHLDTHDQDRGGLDLPQKFIDRDSLEYSLVLAANGDQQQAERARQTLDAARQLIDPVWGGVYQYSTGGRWDRPHYEKIMRSQAGVLRSYAHAYALFADTSYRSAAESIRDYLLAFLRGDNGAFFASQDADLVPGQKAHDYFVLNDRQRRKRGMPRIDRHQYSLQNGQAIEALAYWHEAAGDDAALAAAIEAARWVLTNRRLENEYGFSHGKDTDAIPFLEDNLAMARAFLQLYRATAEREWLTLATRTADYIIRHFRGKSGFRTAAYSRTPLKPAPTIDENISAVRFFNLLAHYSGNNAYRKAAEHGMRYLVAPQVALSRITEAGIMLADRELASDPAHLTVVGHKDDRRAATLYSIALHESGWYKRLEWWDRRQGPLPNADVQYPKFEQPAGYVCTEGRCSSPSFNAEQYQRQIRLLTGNDG